MQLHINDRLRVQDLQERFQKCFPLLKLAFYTKPHKRFQVSNDEFLIDHEKLVGEIRRKGANGFLEIKSWFTTARVERDLEDKFGLHAQIFRQGPAGAWLQTSLSDDLTLYEQGELNNILHHQAANEKH
ncbi:MAG: hypothetical protein EON98_00200 [Chitinophagaceae bacterium]|nr:MAG: hypothetical protein EON98_00200 [Chitinophagaceae bacterium]